MSDSSDAELLNLFWAEVGEYLQSLNAALLQMEMAQTGDHGDLLREMNRVAHSMKGAARAVGIHLIETIAHYMEEVFSAALRGELALTPEVADYLYDGLDLIQNVVNGEENDTETLAEVLARLEQIVVGVAPSPTEHSATVPSVGRAGPQAPPVAGVRPGDGEEEASTLILRPAEETIRVGVHKLDRLMAEASELLVARMQGEERQYAVNQLRRLLRRWQREWHGARAAYIRLARRLRGREDELAADMATLFKFLEANQRYLSESSRQLGLLAQVMAQDNMRLGALADELQDGISGLRLMPFQTVLGGFQRMVRDLARDTDKQIHFEVSGAAIELDKTVLDALKDPIMHLLRNAVDHGIESRSERERQGKPAAGRIELALEQRGNEIVVRISDDGRGIDINRVRRAAVRAGLLSTQEVATLSEDEVRSLIFHPGLSTNDEITALSGRGVGMDIVRNRVEALRGRISVQSTVGKGTTITLNVPVSLTRIRCILLRVGDEDFAVASTAVVRMDTLKRADVFTAEGRDMVIVNGQPVPLVSLHTLLNIPTPPVDGRESFNMLALHASDRVVAFEVDALHSEQELVLKQLGRELAGAPYVSGAALLGSGDVIIVLDANDLVRNASGAATPRRLARGSYTQPRERQLRVLVVDDSITTRTLEKNILETAGFDVRVAIDGQEAWAILSEDSFDVVLTDIEMPRMNGFELTRRIKENAQTRHIPVILLTSLSKPEQREAGWRAGADAYLVKSRFDQDELLRLIQTLVKAPQAGN